MLKESTWAAFFRLQMETYPAATTCLGIYLCIYLMRMSLECVTFFEPNFYIIIQLLFFVVYNELWLSSYAWFFFFLSTRFYWNNQALSSLWTRENTRPDIYNFENWIPDD